MREGLWVLFRASQDAGCMGILAKKRGRRAGVYVNVITYRMHTRGSAANHNRRTLILAASPRCGQVC